MYEVNIFVYTGDRQADILRACTLPNGACALHQAWRKKKWLTATNTIGNGLSMKTSEFKRFLASKGATFAEGSKHTKIYLNGKQSTLPRHQEIAEGLRLAILRQLGVKQKR